MFRRTHRRELELTFDSFLECLEELSSSREETGPGDDLKLKVAAKYLFRLFDEDKDGHIDFVELSIDAPCCGGSKNDL